MGRGKRCVVLSSPGDFGLGGQPVREVLVTDEELERIVPRNRGWSDWSTARNVLEPGTCAVWLGKFLAPLSIIRPTISLSQRRLLARIRPGHS